MKRKILLGLAGVIALLAACTAYMGLTAGRELIAARSVLSSDPSDLGESDIRAARDHLERASDGLDSIASWPLKLLPVARQNIAAADATADAGIPALEAAEQLRAALDDFEGEDVLADGQVRFEVLTPVQERLAEQAEALTELEATLQRHRSGWLLPPLWEALSDLGEKTSLLSAAAHRAQDGIVLARQMLAEGGRRRYVVGLINNSELRGAGGILSGAGTMTVTDGRLGLGSFAYYNDLPNGPPRRVEAPPDMKRRFDRYRAATTLWVNATASPDVPEVADVIGRLYRATTGMDVDGVILIDPVGLASLMPPDMPVEVPGPHEAIAASELPQFVYSDSYETLGGADQARRRALLVIGANAFRAIIEGGAGDRSVIESAGRAMAGGHIRFFSFDSTEQEVIERLGASGDIEMSTTDGTLVTVQNLGADKLDYWMERSIEHRCDIQEAVARCTVSVRLTNIAPRGLPLYVVQEKKSYALYEGYLEVYVPEAAELTGVTRDGVTAEFFAETEDARKSLGMFFDLPRSEATLVRVTYDLPVGDSYSVTLMPQPLARDADYHLELSVPDGWMTQGPDGDSDETLTRSSGTLDTSLEWHARPVERRGLSALWENLVEFWTEPVQL